jgi:TolB-like protein/DNA-binding winged helix-turn-helix (wHTH) protein/Tfp pilus assembly protein PilF
MNAPGERALRIGTATFDPVSGVLAFEGRTTTLRPRTAAVLGHLVQHAGRIVTKDELMAAVWPRSVVTDDSLVQCVKEIRQAFGDAGRHWIRTVPRQGYALVAEAGAQVPGIAAGAAEAAAPVAEVGVPAAGAAPSTGTPTVSTRDRRRWQVAGAAALLLLAVAAWLAAPWSARAPAPSLSIVVMPVRANTGDVHTDYIADALTEEITVDLSRIPDSFVIGRGTAEHYRTRRIDPREAGRELGVRYVLEGKLDRLGPDVWLTMQLLDVESGAALWTERFDGRLGDLAALHRRVTGTVGRSLQLRMIEVASARALRRDPDGAEAEDLALQAWAFVRRHTPGDTAHARELLQRAVARDPGSVLAWTLLAQTYADDVALRHHASRGATREDWLRRGGEAADRAYALDPNHTGAAAARAKILSFQGRADEALAMLDRVLALNPNDAAAWFLRSYTYVTLGRQQEAIQAGMEAIRISPRDHEIAGFYVVMAAAHLYLGREDQALAWARKSALERPRFSVAHSWIASAAGLLDHAETARTAIAEFRRLRPDYTIRTFRAENLCANDACRTQRERYYEGLRKAGLPE